MEQIVPISDLQTKAKHYIGRARESHDPIVITQRGRAAAVLMDYESYWGLVATVDEMSYPNWKSRLEKAERESQNSKGVSLERYLARRRKSNK